MAGVPVELLVGELLAGQLHLLGVDDDHVVAAVHVRGEARLVLAAQDLGDLGSQAAKDNTVSIDQNPFLLDVRRGGGKGFHRANHLSVNSGGSAPAGTRSEEHTSELPSLMRI